MKEAKVKFVNDMDTFSLKMINSPLSLRYAPFVEMKLELLEPNLLTIWIFSLKMVNSPKNPNS